MSSAPQSVNVTRRSLSTSSKATLPLLDIKQYYDNRSDFVEALRVACHKVGFFLLKHDIPAEITRNQLEESRLFFQHSLKEKQSISYRDSRCFRGYMQLGVENTAGAIDWREQIEFAAIYPNVEDHALSWPPYERLKAKANPFPNSFQPTLQVATEAYVPHCRRLADCLRESLCLALGVNKDVLDPLFGKSTSENELPTEQDPPHWVLKLISYPVVDPNDDWHFGVGGHTDTNFLTLVLQDDVGGLQVFSEGEWIDVPSNFDNILVCNLGEQAELMSEGYFLATPHRVLANTNGNRDRISVPLFYNPRLSAVIEPIVRDSSTLTWERGDYEQWRRKSNAMLATVGDNTFKSLARSHPDVFRKHHEDLKLLDNGRIVRKEDDIDSE